jgi:hypothetical protein
MQTSRAETQIFPAAEGLSAAGWRVQENRRLSDFSENIPPLRPWRLCGE